MKISTDKAVSIVIPVHNECEVIEKVVRSIHEEICVNLKDYEFIIAEDGSTDGTTDILRRLEKEIPMKLVHSDERKGYAKGVRDALRLASKDIVFFLDSDGQHKVTDFWKMLTFIDDFDIVSGYKCPRTDPPYRLLISRIMNTFIFFMYGCFFRDINSGFKLFRREALVSLLKISNDLDFVSTEFLIKAYLLKMKIAEVPVIHYERQFGESRGLPASRLPYATIRLLIGFFKIKIFNTFI